MHVHQLSVYHQRTPTIVQAYVGLSCVTGWVLFFINCCKYLCWLVSRFILSSLGPERILMPYLAFDQLHFYLQQFFRDLRIVPSQPGAAGCSVVTSSRWLYLVLEKMVRLFWPSLGQNKLLMPYLAFGHLELDRISVPWCVHPVGHEWLADGRAGPSCIMEWQKRHQQVNNTHPGGRRLKSIPWWCR